MITWPLQITGAICSTVADIENVAKYRLILNDSLHTMVKDVGISNGLGNQQTKHILYVASLPENLPEQNVNIQRD